MRTLQKPVSRASVPGRAAPGPVDFFREVRAEVRKAVWPTRKEATHLTILVILLSGAVGLFLGGVDILLAELFQRLVR